MADDGYARYMRDHGIPAEGWTPPLMDGEEEDEETKNTEEGSADHEHNDTSEDSAG